MHKITLYHLRFFAYLPLIIIAFVGQFTNYLSQTTFIVLLCLAIITPCIGYLSSLTDSHDPLALVLLDAIVVSFITLLFGFTNILTLVFIVIIIFNSYINTNARYTLLTLLIILCFILIVSILIDSTFFSPPPDNLLICYISFAGFYFCMCGRYFHQGEMEKKKLRQQINHIEKEQQLTAKKLNKYLSPQIWESFFGFKKYDRIETSRKKLTVFFSDIKGFTQLSEELEAEALTEMLNHYLTEMSNIAQSYNGTIDKFIGDSMMIFFGDTNSLGAKNDAIAATSMALAMQKHMKSIRNYWLSRGINHQLEIRMGINTGFCTVGNFGANTRMDYTAIGREVNLASRLENAANPGEILISEETYGLIKDIVLCRDKGEISVNGFYKPTRIYTVLGLIQNLVTEICYIEHDTKGFSVYLDSVNIDPEEKFKIIEMLEGAIDSLKDK